MVDKRKDSDSAVDNLLDEDQDLNLVSSLSTRDISKLQLRNKKNQTQETEQEQQLETAQTELQSQTSIFQVQPWAKPFEENFSLDSVPSEDDAEWNDGLEAGCTREGAKKWSMGRKAKAVTEATIAAGAISAVEIGRRQKEFHNTLPDVEKTTGVPAKLVGAFWGNESSFGKNLVSPTGCLGDGQFTRTTWAAMIKQYGDRIPGMEQYATDLRSGKIKWNDEGLQKMRLDTKASAYAMGFYINEVARELKVDPKDEKNWGIIYAGYNVGPGSAKKLRNNMDSNGSAMAMLGSVAQNNPMFYDKGRATPAQAVANYNVVISQSAKRYETKVAAIIDGADVSVAKTDSKDKKSEPISVASTVSASTIAAAAKPKAEFGDPKGTEAAVKVAQAEMSVVDRVKAKLASFSYGFDDAPKDPAPKLAENKPKVPLHNLVYG